MDTNYAYQIVAPHLKNLRLCAYYQIDPRSPEIYKLLHNIYMRVGLIWICVFTLQQALKIYETRDDIDKVMATLFLFLTHTDSIYKQVVFSIRADKLEELLDIMRGPLYNQGEAVHNTYLLNTARHGVLLLRFDNCMAIITCFLWALYPLLQHLNGKSVEFGIWMPFDYNSGFVFYVTIIYVWITTSSQGFGNTTMDVIIAFLLAQCQTQLRILRYDLMNIVQKSKEEALNSSDSYEQVLKRRFKKALDHHMEILQYGTLQIIGHVLPVLPLTFYLCDLGEMLCCFGYRVLGFFAQSVEDIFNGAIFYQFLIGGWIICTAIYRIVDMDPFSVEFFSMMSYMCCIVTQIFVYCHYGTEVTYESEKLNEAIYQMEWLHTPLVHQKDMIMFMERGKRSIKPIAGTIPLSNETFVTIVKSSYSFFTLLKATGE